MMNPHPDDAFDEHTTERLVIRRFRAEDAATLAAYRSDPAVARYQSWDIPFSLA
jgi:RimJ/RimL family protein N-acetyltransferase